MKILNQISFEEAKAVCRRPVFSNEEIMPMIADIFSKVRSEGDLALKELTKKFDNVELGVLSANQEELSAAAESLDIEVVNAIKIAADNIRKFHRSQLSKPNKVQTFTGVQCWQESRAIEKIGIYIPGGTAPLFSTVLMLAIPAQIAGCKEVVLCTPPKQDGKIDPHILFAAQLTGVTQIYKIGGAQAIAALTLGTESIPAVNKIFGPGNQYVTAAKTMAQQFGVAIDMPAGPSELMVVADESSNPAFVASDLLSQAEHGTDSQVICLVDSVDLANQIAEEVETQMQLLPRKDIAQKSIANSSIIVESDRSKIIEIINEYGPEHLIIATDWNEDLLPKIQNAGSVFIGNFTPESAGDYASGTNHTLPTNGFAKSYSGVNLDAFVKKITFQEISENGIKELGPIIESMAAAEQLEAHKNAVTIRLKALEK